MRAFAFTLRKQLWTGPYEFVGTFIKEQILRRGDEYRRAFRAKKAKEAGETLLPRGARAWPKEIIEWGKTIVFHCGRKAWHLMRGRSNQKPTVFLPAYETLMQHMPKVATADDVTICERAKEVCDFLKLMGVTKVVVSGDWRDRARARESRHEYDKLTCRH